MTIKNLGKAFLAIALSGLLLTPAMAQNAGGGFAGRGGPGGGQGRGNFDPTTIRQQQNQQLKDELAATDEEWAVLAPKIEAVQRLVADSGGGLAGVLGMARRFNRGGGGAAGSSRQMMSMIGGMSGMSPEMQAALADLSDAMNNPNANDQLIKERLTAVRSLRAKAKVELEKARQDLIQFLTTKQEAILFQNGLIE